MKYTVEYRLLTSTYHPFEGDGILRQGIEKGKAVSPKDLTENKSFDANTEAEALQIAQYIAYHMARVTNPHEFSDEKLGFSEVTLLNLSDNLGKKLEIPKPGNHFADCAVKKWLRGNGEDHFVEIVGLNSDLIVPYDWLTANNKRTTTEDELMNIQMNGSSQIKTFFKEYLPFLREKKLVNYFPNNPAVVMLSYQRELVGTLQQLAEAQKPENDTLSHGYTDEELLEMKRKLEKKVGTVHDDKEIVPE